MGLLAYILILVPAAIGALEALGLTALTAPLTVMLSQFLSVVPLLFFAAVVLAISYVVARLVADLATAALAALGADALPARLGLSRVVPAEGEGRPLSRLVGQLILLVIMTLATIEAADLLGFTAVATLLSAFLVLLGQVLLGLLVLAVGLYLANVLAGVVAASGAPRADLLAVVTRVAVIALAVPMALKQIGLGDEIVVLAFGLLLGGAVLGLAVAVGVAFGIGGPARPRSWSPSGAGGCRARGRGHPGPGGPGLAGRRRPPAPAPATDPPRAARPPPAARRDPAGDRATTGGGRGRARPRLPPPRGAAAQDDLDERLVLVVLAGLLPLAGRAPPAFAQAGRPTGPTQGQVVGATYLNRPAGYTHQLPPSWISHGYKWYEYWGPRAARRVPARRSSPTGSTCRWTGASRRRPCSRSRSTRPPSGSPGGPGRAAGRAGARQDRPVGVRLERAPGRAVRRRLGRRPAGGGPVRRRPVITDRSACCLRRRAPPALAPVLVGPTWAWPDWRRPGRRVRSTSRTRGAIPSDSTPTGRTTPRPTTTCSAGGTSARRELTLAPGPATLRSAPRLRCPTSSRCCSGRWRATASRGRRWS